MSNTPQIRFAGFTDAWEQRKLEEICEQVKETVDPQLTPDTKFYEYSMPAFDDNSRADIVSGYDMNSIRKVINAPCLLINKLNVRKKRIWLVEKPEKNAVCSAEFVPVTSDVSDLSFLKYTTLKDDFTAYLEDCSSGSSNSQKRVTPDVIMKATIQIPTIAEQSIIGTFFSNLDSIITLHQRKCDALQKFKKSMLQKIFPKNGSLYPEIRFAGFTDAWEQRKLGSISEKVTRKNQDMVCDEIFTNSAEYGIISQRDFFDKDIANSENIDGYYIVEPNDFVYNPRISNLAPFGPIRRNKLEKSGAMSPLYYVFRTHGVDYGFLEYYFKTNGWHSFMHLNGNSGARSDRFAIRDDIFKEMPITMPQNVVEQQAVGKYFTNLDHLITLHQRKLETLKKLKKSMLQKMFI